MLLNLDAISYRGCHWQYHLLLEVLEGEVVLVFNELVFAPIVEVVVT